MMSQSIHDKQSSINWGKVKVLENNKANNNNKFILRTLGATLYDTATNSNEIKLNIEETMKKLKIKWHTLDPDQLKKMIQRQLVYELTLCEERKQVCRLAKEKQNKMKEKEEEIVETTT